MTHLFRRLTGCPVNVIGVLPSLTLLISIGIIIGYYMSGSGSHITTTASANAASISLASQSPDPFAPCVPAAANAIACENSKPGNPAGQWDISGAGSNSIQGFATDISVNRGEIVRFKIDTTPLSTNYRLDIYRLGYYGGQGARFITTVQPSAQLPQSVPSCLTDNSTGLVDCGNWSESASWAVPSNATSGIYIAKLVREDGVNGESHIVFIVRDDNGGSDLLFQTSDTTWQAYNSYGGNSLYEGAPVGRAYKVSYNRPFNTRGHNQFRNSWLFDSEYPMLRWLEANGYDVSYFTGIDSDRRGQEIQEHEVFLSVGHDEYWSGAQRTNVEAARDSGVHLAFFSGNTMFWKTRWENSIGGPSTPYRTLVCYKETHANAKIDPMPNVWTGTWRDPRFSPPADGGQPENEVMGTLFTVNCCREDAIRVPAALGKFRFWRNTTVANLSAGQTATVGSKTVGYEWDEDLSNGFRPSGLFRLSSNTLNISSYLLDHGSTYGNGTATHSLTLYRQNNGAYVFSAATIRWAWGLDNNHDQNGASSIPAPDTRMRQATVNLFADMGVQPGTLQSGLIPASQSADTQAPVATITTPIGGASLPVGAPVNITGTATDSGGGLVAAVNVSVDGGATWNRTTGTNSWSFSWTPTVTGPVTIKSIAVDDSGNAQNPPAQISVTVVPPAPPQCPCSLWGSGVTPAVTAYSETAELELGVKFQSDVSGWVNKLRFYKGSTNTGTHIGSLWTSNGTLLGRATYSGETASGWQEVTLATPVAIAANTTYVASYHTTVGHYAVNNGYFATSGVINPPLRAPATGAIGGNGVFKYGAISFPNQTFNGNNYWVDVVFVTAQPPQDTTPPTVTAFTPAAGATNVSIGTNVTVTFSEAMDAATINGATVELTNFSNALVPATVSYDSATRTATLDPAAALAHQASYTARVRGGGADPRVKDVAGNAMAANVSWTFTTESPPPPPQCPCSLWGTGATPANLTDAFNDPVELGLKFHSDRSGHISGVRFYKGGASNSGTHIGRLWTSSGTLLGSVTFTNETASGWQQALFAAPVQIAANTTYVVSYFAPQGHFSYDSNYFASSGVDNFPLHALSSALAGGNGVFHYAPSGGFPTNTFQATNYWVDVVFIDTEALPPQVFSVTPASGATTVPINTTPSAVFSKALDVASLTSSTVLLRDAANNQIPVNPSYSPSSYTLTLTPQQPLQAGQTYTVTLKGGAAPRITDTTGTPLASDYTWSFTTATSIFSIWPGAATPAIPTTSDGNSVELGLKFQSDRSGHISGVRFYKGDASNGGTHIGSLWTSSGTLLGSVIFTNETASGWQQALFATPVQITANTTYVVSYFAPQGHYSMNSNYFSSSGVDNAPLHALSNALAGGNAVFFYGASGGFPNGSFQAANYWVDVVFLDTEALPPQVFSVTPASGATTVPINTTPSAVFSKALDVASLTSSTVFLRDAANNQVPGAISYSPATFTVTLTPQQTLQAGQTYTVTLKGGAAPRITDTTGTPLISNFTWSFTTGN